MWRLIFPALAHVLFAAHCMFHSWPELMTIPSALIVALLVRHRFVPWIQLVALLVFAAEWVRTGWMLVEMRRLYGMPWVTAACILGGVALFTFLAALPIFDRKLKDWYLRT